MTINIMDLIYNDDYMLNKICYCDNGIINKVKLKDCCSKGKRNSMKVGIKIASYMNNSENYNPNECLCPVSMKNSCDSQQNVNAIKSHSVSRDQNLTKISENNEIYSFKTKLKNGKFSFNYNFEKEKIRSASTYLGFCSFHDNLLFKKIDKGIDPLNNEDFFMIRYRLLGKEIRSHEINIYKLNKIVNFFKWINKNKKNKYLEGQKKIEKYINNMNIEYLELLKEKAFMDDLIKIENKIVSVKEKIFSNISISMGNNIDFLVDSCFSICDKKIYLNLSYDKSNKPLLSFYFKKEDCNPIILNFIDNLCDENLLNRIYYLSLTNITNTYSYYRVSFIENMPKEKHEYILNKNRVKTHYNKEEINVLDMIDSKINCKILKKIKNI